LAAILALGLAVSATPAKAQMPLGDSGGNKLPEKYYMAKNTLFLPVDVDPLSVPNIKEILFYVKDGAGKPWDLLAKVPPTQKGFECKLPKDGEYWFSVVTIDRTGVASPSDVNKEPPAVIVVLDTCDPQLELKTMPLSPEGICMKCEVRDANPNPAQTKFEYQDGNKNWRVLSPMPGQQDCFCIPHVAVWTGMVKVTCADRASHTVTKEFNFSDLAMKAASPPATTGDNGVTKVAYNPEPSSVQQTQPAKTTSNIAAELIKTVPTQPAMPQQLPIQPSDIMPPQNLNCQQANCAKPAAGKCMIVSQPRISLDYRIEDEGKSGVGKVEVWITKDNGRTWDVLCEDPDKKSPAVFDLPGEGTYGIRLSVTNGRGFGATPPKSGEVPDYVVELDTTKPTAELKSVKLATDDCACIEIVWQANDKNLGSASVDLYYSSSAQGTWTPIAKGQPNSGKYRWFPPQSIGKEAYVRMVVTDVAGNSVRCDAAEAVALDDGTRPRVTIEGIGTAPKATGLGPIGN